MLAAGPPTGASPRTSPTEPSERPGGLCAPLLKHHCADRHTAAGRQVQLLPCRPHLRAHPPTAAATSAAAPRCHPRRHAHNCPYHQQQPGRRAGPGGGSVHLRNPAPQQVCNQGRGAAVGRRAPGAPARRGRAGKHAVPASASAHVYTTPGGDCCCSWFQEALPLQLPDAAAVSIAFRRSWKEEISGERGEAVKTALLPCFPAGPGV